MRPSQSNPTKRKVTRSLSPQTIDKKRQTSEFRRQESMAAHRHRLSVFAMYGVVIAIPLLYAGWLISTWIYNPAQLPNVFYTGGGALAGFLLSKVNLFNDKKQRDE